MSLKQESDKSELQNLYQKNRLFDNEKVDGNDSRKLINRVPFFVSLLAVLIIFIDLGFVHNNALRIIFNIYYNVVLLIGILSISKPYIKNRKINLSKAYFIDIVLLSALLLVLLYNVWIIITNSLQSTHSFITLFLVVSFFIREFFNLRMEINYRRLGPAQIFVISFFTIIFLGSFLLMLPKATIGNISYVDALFTSTSAVCVTGLNVVDVEFTYTILGQVIIMFLIQIGGLGIMTITTYFSYFFKGGSSYKNQLLVKDITNDERLDNVFSSLKSILTITFIIEGLGFLLIFLSLNNVNLSLGEKAFFSIFHAVSGFCNAGYSTLSGNLYDIRIRFDYPVHLIISGLIIFGGLGFPIIHNIWEYVTTNIRDIIKRVFKHEKYTYSTLVINVNSQIVIITTLILLIVGTVGFYVFEKDGVLTEYSSEFGKWTAAFFGSVTTRTAGFNSTDTGALTIPTSLLFIVLMWIGASPASTGGGIKQVLLLLLS